MSNREWSKLTPEEQTHVVVHYIACVGDKTMDCYKKHKNVKEFWKVHRVEDYPQWD